MRPRCLALVLALLLGSAGSGDDLAPLVPWSALATSPGRHLGEARQVFVQFHSFEESWNPFLTRFGPASFVTLRGWSDEQRPWKREDYDAPAVRVFVRRGGDLETLFRQAQAHQRYELVLAAREHCAGELWCEVLSARRLKKEIPEGTVMHAARAIELLERQAWDLAAGELERALAAPLPEAARDELLLLQERAQARGR